MKKTFTKSVNIPNAPRAFSFLLFSFLLFSLLPPTFAQTITNAKFEYSCPCRVTVTYDLSAIGAADVVLYYNNTDTVGYSSYGVTDNWLPADTFRRATETNLTNIVDIWNCEAAGKVYGLFYFKLQPVSAPCRGDFASKPYVTINDVDWATRNVDAPGFFAVNPTDAGMFYQWDRRIGWSSTDPMVSSPTGNPWNTASSSNPTWQSGTDPSPPGYRVPTPEQIDLLLEVDREWMTIDSVSGYCFIDRTNDNSIFLPAASYRYFTDGALNAANFGVYGYYWSRTEYNATNAWYLHFVDGSADRILHLQEIRL